MGLSSRGVIYCVAHTIPLYDLAAPYFTITETCNKESSPYKFKSDQTRKQVETTYSIRHKAAQNITLQTKKGRVTPAFFIYSSLNY
jgi:hypothetical protein